MIKTILVVDDSPIMRKIMRSCIPKDVPCEILEATNGLEGFEMYRSHMPDVTFMDLTMPVMNGMESLAEIMKFNRDAVVVICTADVQIKSLTKALELGAREVIKKPPTKEKISAALIQAEENLRSRHVG